MRRYRVHRQTIEEHLPDRTCASLQSVHLPGQPYDRAHRLLQLTQETLAQPLQAQMLARVIPIGVQHTSMRMPICRDTPEIRPTKRALAMTEKSSPRFATSSAATHRSYAPQDGILGIADHVPPPCHRKRTLHGPAINVRQAYRQACLMDRKLIEVSMVTLGGTSLRYAASISQVGRTRTSGRVTSSTECPACRNTSRARRRSIVHTTGGNRPVAAEYGGFRWCYGVVVFSVSAGLTPHELPIYAVEEPGVAIREPVSRWCPFSARGVPLGKTANLDPSDIINSQQRYCVLLAAVAF